MCALLCVIFFFFLPSQAGNWGSEVTREPWPAGGDWPGWWPSGSAGGAGKGRLAQSEAKGFGLPEGVAFPARVGSMGCNYTAPGWELVGRERELAGGRRQEGARTAQTHVTLIDSKSRCDARELLGYVVFSRSRLLVRSSNIHSGKLRHSQHVQPPNSL